MKYKKNFLTNVVFQLRFSPVLAMDNQGLGKFQQNVKSILPQLKEGKELDIETKMSLKEPISTQVKETRPRWTFFSQDKEKILAITTKEFTLEYRRYLDIEETSSDFEALWTKFQEVYEVSQVDRIGLRYINQVKIPSGDPLDWEGYVHDNLVDATLGPSQLTGERLARSMHAINWTNEDHRITFQFGLHNSDFPEAIAKKEFILDYDCYTVGPVDGSEASKFLRIFNEIIGKLFEACIGQKLRDFMGVEKE